MAELLLKCNLYSNLQSGTVCQCTFPCLECQLSSLDCVKKLLLSNGQSYPDPLSSYRSHEVLGQLPIHQYINHVYLPKEQIKSIKNSQNPSVSTVIAANFKQIDLNWRTVSTVIAANFKQIDLNWRNYIVEGLLAVGEYKLADCVCTEQGINEQAPLDLACIRWKDQLNTVKCLITGYGVDINEINEQTPLHLACKKGQLDTVKCLVIEYGVDINGNVNNDGRIPLGLTPNESKLDVVKYLISESDMDITVNGYSDYRRPLELAASESILKYFFSVNEVDVNHSWIKLYDTQGSKFKCFKALAGRDIGWSILIADKCVDENLVENLILSILAKLKCYSKQITVDVEKHGHWISSMDTVLQKYAHKLAGHRKKSFTLLILRFESCKKLMLEYYENNDFCVVPYQKKICNNNLLAGNIEVSFVNSCKTGKAIIDCNIYCCVTQPLLLLIANKKLRKLCSKRIVTCQHEIELLSDLLLPSPNECTNTIPLEDGDDSLFISCLNDFILQHGIPVKKDVEDSLYKCVLRCDLDDSLLLCSSIKIDNKALSIQRKSGTNIEINCLILQMHHFVTLSIIEQPCPILNGVPIQNCIVNFFVDSSYLSSKICAIKSNSDQQKDNISGKKRKIIGQNPLFKQMYVISLRQGLTYTNNKHSEKCTSLKRKQIRQRAAQRRQHYNSNLSSFSYTAELCLESNSCESYLERIDIDSLIPVKDQLRFYRNIPNKWPILSDLHISQYSDNKHSLSGCYTPSEMIRLLVRHAPAVVYIENVTVSTRDIVLEQQSVTGNVYSNSQLFTKYSVHRCQIALTRVGKKGKRVKKIKLKTETFYDCSKSKLVHGSCSGRVLSIVRSLQTPTSEYTTSSSRSEVLSQSRESSLGHMGNSQLSSSNQDLSSSHSEIIGGQHLRSDKISETTAEASVAELIPFNELTAASTKIKSKGSPEQLCTDYELTASSTKIKAKGSPEQLRTDYVLTVSSTKIKSKGVGKQVCTDSELPQLDSEVRHCRTSPDSRQRKYVNKEIRVGDSEHRGACYASEEIRTNNSEAHAEHRGALTHTSPQWITAVTQLLHVPDYPKMIQRLNNESPSSEYLVSHRFIRGIAYFKIGKFQQAMRDLTEGETYAQQTNERGGVSLCNVYLGDLYYSSGSYKEAAKCYQKATDYHDSDEIAKQFRMVAPTLSAIHAKCGSCFRTLSKSVEAIQEYRKAIESAVKEKDRLTAHTSLGNLYQSSGQNKEALKEYKEALELAQRLSDHVSVAWTHGNIGNAYLGLGMKDQALFNLKKALDLTIKYEPTPAAIGRAYNNIGTSYQSMGDLDKAEEHYDLALSQAIYGNDPAGQARVYGNIGNIFIVRKMFEKAIPHYSEVLRLSTDESTVTTALHNRGCAYYEWAESKMTALEKSSSSRTDPAPGQVVFRIHCSKAVSHEHSPRIVIDSIFKLYKQGKEDLEKVLASHERKLDHIKGSAKGLSLTVSLFESNSRTFHRLQDCMVNLGNWREALLVAEQSKARTLGEMMLVRKGSQLERPLTSPLSIEQVYTIVSSQTSPVLYLSHTGASILGWVLVPTEGSSTIFMEMFEVPLSDDQFDGKSFDYHIRYNLTEILVEQSYEMYSSVEYSEKYTSPVVTLFELIGRPLLMILKKVRSIDTLQKIVIATDTYTTLLPFACMYDSDNKKFLGEMFYFDIVPSLLTMGIMNQLPEPVVELPADPQNMCIIGNPTIPQFYHNNEVWSLGKLPYAKREAQWVGHILNTPPILEEQATKSAILMRFMRAKVIHIATHGSSVSGFLAFSALTHTRQGEVVDSSSVLLHPEEVEKLSISPALVVLSSCDSARGTVKADGIQGMARAFILAGAQAVMTALWRVPDESAAVFMRFFYRFLEEGFESSLALQKSILSLRCFAKYSQYIHWSGYQLTGRSIRFDTKPSPVTRILEATLGQSSVFPRLMLMKKLQSALVDNPRLPTDIQVLHGSPGVKPSEVAIDFIHSCHSTFSAGIFWLNCRTPDQIDANLLYIEKVLKKSLGKLRLNETQQALFILDNPVELPSSHQLLQLFRHSNAHIIILSKHSEPLDPLIKEIDKVLIRGSKIHEVKTLSMIDSTQRTVYEVFRKYHLSANNDDQKILENLAEFTSGSPVIVDMAIHVLVKVFSDFCENPSKGLCSFSDAIHLTLSRKHMNLQAVSTEKYFQVREISTELTRIAPAVVSVPPNHKDVWESESEYDSWDSIAALLDCCISSPGEMLLLRSLAIFGCCPVPIPLVTTMSSFIAQSSGHSHLSGILHERLMEAKLLRKYPLPVVLHSSYTQDNIPTDPQFVYVPQHLADYLWTCEHVDQLVAITLAFKALKKLTSAHISVPMQYYLGLLSLLEEKTGLLRDVKQCFGEIYGLYLTTSHKMHYQNTTEHPDAEHIQHYLSA